ncbi:hypothetical protein [Planctomycetes bacterium TBK1r]|uniref:Uncharacterized protein n=1 Tax=Stieleria magnilauensis TaxID=2527963 RepID=A0ABX5XUQ1_9BACT|nr:hypothetical protein TBK1r_39630 [Planctomycetes bacterium TBK1r]
MTKAALKTLFSTYWCSAGWVPQSERHIEPDAFAHAKAAGVMFDPLFVSHDELVERGRKLSVSIAKSRVVDAFLASLSTRCLELRSALSSWAYLRHFPAHSHTGAGMCDVCGSYNMPEKGQDLNVLNFERFKWGGCRHDDLMFAVFNLERFTDIERLTPTAEDHELFEQCIAAIRSVPAETTAANLHKAIPKAVRSNKDERDVLLDILGIAGVLQTESHNGYLNRFVEYRDRQLPAQRFVDRRYPFCWWRGSDGVNSATLLELFDMT